MKQNLWFTFHENLINRIEMNSPGFVQYYFGLSCLSPIIILIFVAGCKLTEKTQPSSNLSKSEFYGERLSGEVLVRVEWFHGDSVEFLLFDLRGDSALYHDTLPVESNTFCYDYGGTANCLIKQDSVLTALNPEENTATFDTLKPLAHELVFFPLEYYLNDAANSKMELPEKLPTLILSDDKSFNGYTGCNSMFGEYEVSGDSMQFDKIGSTRRYCGEKNPESTFMKALSNSARYKRTGRKIYFYNAGDSLLLELNPYR